MILMLVMMLMLPMSQEIIVTIAIAKKSTFILPRAAFHHVDYQPS